MLVLGVLGLLIGVAYGVFGVPIGSTFLLLMLTAYGFTFVEAVASTMLVSLIPVTFGGVFVYWKNGIIRLNETIFIAILIAIGATVGAVIMSKKTISLQIQKLTAGVIYLIIGAYYVVSYSS